ncbi:MAG: phage antirepressor KilAC domain-containing protein [Gammaproteobacteria bacterium]|uniref:Putative antirepressor protein n=1 Tax=viral metagenome TaxID=1070528 RepID=A0A6M3M159_9ZZZZ|nr:phage antirepressor KilAC domain-containing protein [Gammaproteobacteria bacterium]MBU0883279.1 phage antirepressor KilAC domain-containing protein [Gammaproteobacteria bacterium]
MNRDLNQAAAVLGIGPRKLRDQLRERGIINHQGELACRYRDKGHLYTETRRRHNKAINAWTHYGVVMATEAGIAWLAEQLAKPVVNKDAAA